MRICEAQNCSMLHHARGYCIKHYAQMLRFGKIFDRTLRDGCEFIQDGMLYRIKMFDKHGNQKAIAIIDAEDYNKVKDYSWHVGGKPGGSQYPIAYNKSGGVKVRLHNIILSNGSVDHKSGDTLDNRKVNLRYATMSENNRNARKTDTDTSSIYKGVCWNKEKLSWQAQIYKGRTYYLGRYGNEWSAAQAYNRAAVKLFGEFSKLNVEGEGCP